MKKLALVAVLVSAMFPSLAQADINFGVASNRGEVATRQAWADVTKLLSDELGTPVTLVTVPIEKSIEAFSNKDVDYFLANPLICATVVVKNGAKPLLTRDGGKGERFGGVIIANKDSGIKSIEDMRGKKLMTYTRDSAGAYLFQAYELSKHGIDINTDFAKNVVAKKQDDIPMAVKAGLFDAGFVRTGILESMAKEGLLSLDDFVIVNKVDDDYPEIHSTNLYPEWGLVAQSEVDPEVSKKLTDYLLSLKSDDPAMQKAETKGFVAAQDLGPLVEVMTALRIPPFDK